ncbi:hypothetical protein ZTR_09020 [Talaromyces verruculosus]|nr:hypothetical protein ZTR_09020 [Talaromyces verruculosus]
MVRVLPLVALGWTTFTVGSYALDFYVASSSNPSGDGSSPHSPFSNLVDAQAAVRKVTGQMSENVTVHVADGLYILDAPLNFTSADSGQNGHTVIWQATGTNATISGGVQVTDWKLVNGSSNIYSANVTKGLLSRNLFVNGWAANYARQKVKRGDFQFTNTSITWTSPQYDWLMTTPGMENAEIRAINSFTDRYAPIESVPNADFGMYVQNALALLSQGGEHYLDSDAGIVYYIPLANESMDTAETFLGRLEALFVVGGTYDSPAHDVSFVGLNFKHTTWLRPGQYGYVDQQTGGYIGENVTYPQFEASRPRWWQIPSAIQVSAAKRISFTGGSYTELGAGGIGIGNDDNAHLTGVGLGANDVTVADGYFTQVMANSITAGGIKADSHHPSDPRMINANIHLTGNIFYNISSLFSSTVSILATYVQYSEISHNDVSSMPYSGICHGYGWGANDAGGSQTYITRGLYNYQPLYDTPTTSMKNVIKGNLIHSYGLSHSDLGAIYTLSKSPDTHISENYAYDSNWYGLYTDEGSNSLIATQNNYLSDGSWFAPNQGCATCGVHTANNTLINNFGHNQGDRVNSPNGTGAFNDTFLGNLNVPSLDLTSEAGHRAAYRAGVTPNGRGSRPVTNPITSDSYLALNFLNGSQPGEFIVMADMSNFDDSDFTNVVFQSSLNDNVNYELTPRGSILLTVPANGIASANWTLSTKSNLLCVTPPTVHVNVTYHNPRTRVSNTITDGGTFPGMQPVPSGLTASSTWPFVTAGQVCSSGNNTVLGIRVGGRDVYAPYDDWAAIYKHSSLGTNGSVTAQVLALDVEDPWTKAGVVVRNNLAAKSGQYGSDNSLGYAGVFLTGDYGVSFQWDGNNDGQLETLSTVHNLKAPIWVRLAVAGNQFTGFFSSDGKNWTELHSVTLPSRLGSSDAGVLVSSHAGFTSATGVFSGLSFA